MKLRGWMFLLPLPFLAIVLVVVILSRWGGWVISQIVVSFFGTAVLLHDAHQDPVTRALVFAIIWAAAAGNASLYIRHVARRRNTAQATSGASFDLAPYRRRN
ncbi:hypothetical protein [Plantibacter sp. MMLR14_011]|uniref:hypothetical protein n=1 Tax=Plantibacter sp. MMLR14_011 TaxID=1898746 RepID=UPI0008DC97E4|nr:hypothetical protein [Plantibacter sp. MMLR14_011]OII39292.1 hypothetical protein BIU99_07880 [Plantibacter sp. MMLR14_011]